MKDESNHNTASPAADGRTAAGSSKGARGNGRAKGATVNQSCGKNVKTLAFTPAGG
jgi:hypothetical protein